MKRRDKDKKIKIRNHRRSVFFFLYLLFSDACWSIFRNIFPQPLSRFYFLFFPFFARACCHSNVALTGITLTAAAAAWSSPAAQSCKHSLCHIREIVRWTRICFNLLLASAACQQATLSLLEGSFHDSELVQSQWMCRLTVCSSVWSC